MTNLVSRKNKKTVRACSITYMRLYVSSVSFSHFTYIDIINFLGHSLSFEILKHVKVITDKFEPLLRVL
jgi:hypothetical protein